MTIEIQRVVKEISPLQVLEKRVEETAEAVSSWKNTVKQITSELNIATAARDKAKNTRATFALKAAMRDTHAVSEVENARSAQASAEQAITDLAEALPASEMELAGAEKAAESARREVAQYHAQQLQRQRVEVAGQLDAAISDFTRLFGEFEKLGNQIANMEAVPRNMHGMADHESAIGLRRVRAAFPKLMDRVFLNTHDETKKEALAVSEARHWNLAPIESNEKAA